jgi:hypothetical protein
MAPIEAGPQVRSAPADPTPALVFAPAACALDRKSTASRGLMAAI